MGWSCLTPLLVGLAQMTHDESHFAGGVHLRFGVKVAAVDLVHQTGAVAHPAAQLGHGDVGGEGFEIDGGQIDLVVAANGEFWFFHRGLDLFHNCLDFNTFKSLFYPLNLLFFEEISKD